MNRQELITFYRNNGMAVFKLMGKKPLERAWQHTPVASLDAYGYKGNIGANLTNDIVVIDIDPRNFPKHPNGDIKSNSALELFEACGITKPNTLKVVTGMGGLHIYFRKPPGLMCKKNLDKDGFKGIDVKTRNGEKGAYVVMPTSIHPDSKKTYVLKEECTSIMDIPKTLMSLIEKKVVVQQEITNVKPEVGESNIEVAKSMYVQYLLKADIAVEGVSGDRTTFNVACMGRDYGLDVTNTYFCMLEYWNDRCEPPWDDTGLIEKVQNAFRYASGEEGAKDTQRLLDNIGPKQEVVKIVWDFYGDGNTLKKTLYNTVNYFTLPAAKLRNLLRYNEFTQQMEFTECPPWQTELYRTSWGDEDITACRYYLSSKYGFEVPPKIIDEAAKILALKNRCHPVREYLDGLKWDGVCRLNRWLPKYGNVANNAFSRAVGRKLIIGAVARIYNPGCKFDYVTVLEGKQGYYKSTLVSVLGGEWYAEIDVDPKNKDIIHAMSGKWFVELSEMETTRKADADALKSFITRQTDRIRLPYDRYATDMKRQCIFIGTINPQVGIGYLKDSTGNRRFWCLEVEKHCDTDGLKIVRDQLFAEATHLYRKGELLYMDNQEVDEIARIEADKRAAGDPWQNSIEAALGKDKDCTKITPINVYALALGGKPIDFSIRESVRIQRAMKALGWAYTIELNEYGNKEGVFNKHG